MKNLFIAFITTTLFFGQTILNQEAFETQTNVKDYYTSASGSNCQNITLSITFDDFPADIRWELRDNNDVIVAFDENFDNETFANQTVTYEICLNGCYDFIILDSFGDGLCCTNGSGSYTITDLDNNILVFDDNFTGSGTTSNFCIGTLSNSDVVANNPSFKAYPVPFINDIFLEYKFNYETDITIEVYDLKGALINSVIIKDYKVGTKSKTKMDLSKLSDQLYFVKLTTRKGTEVKKIVLN